MQAGGGDLLGWPPLGPGSRRPPRPPACFSCITSSSTPRRPAVGRGRRGTKVGGAQSLPPGSKRLSSQRGGPAYQGRRPEAGVLGVACDSPDWAEPEQGAQPDRPGRRRPPFPGGARPQRPGREVPGDPAESSPAARPPHARATAAGAQTRNDAARVRRGQPAGEAERPAQNAARRRGSRPRGTPGPAVRCSVGPPLSWPAPSARGAQWERRPGRPAPRRRTSMPGHGCCRRRVLELSARRLPPTAALNHPQAGRGPTRSRRRHRSRRRPGGRRAGHMASILLRSCRGRGPARLPPPRSAAPRGKRPALGRRRGAGAWGRGPGWAGRGRPRGRPPPQTGRVAGLGPSPEPGSHRGGVP